MIFPPDAHPAYPALTPLFASAEPSFQALLAAAGRHAADLARIRDGGPGLIGGRPARFAQEWFPRLDAVAAYTIVREARPARILEVGCGHSSRFMAQAIADGGLATAFTCVDPSPRAPLAGLPLRHAARPFGPEDAEAAAGFAANDIVFVDASHVVEEGGEVDRLLLDVLPRLPAGALVHVHDVFLPDGYPAAWAGRRYNEQTAVGALLGGGGWEIVFASRYVATRTALLAGSIVERLPLAPEAPEVSLWLRKRGVRRPPPWSLSDSHIPSHRSWRPSPLAGEGVDAKRRRMRGQPRRSPIGPCIVERRAMPPHPTSLREATFSRQGRRDEHPGRETCGHRSHERQQWPMSRPVIVRESDPSPP